MIKSACEKPEGLKAYPFQGSLRFRWKLGQPFFVENFISSKFVALMERKRTRKEKIEGSISKSRILIVANRSAFEELSKVPIGGFTVLSKIAD